MMKKLPRGLFKSHEGVYFTIFIFFIFNYLDSTSYAGSRLLLFNAIKTTLPNAIAITILSKSNGINGITHTLNA